MAVLLEKAGSPWRNQSGTEGGGEQSSPPPPPASQFAGQRQENNPHPPAPQSAAGSPETAAGSPTHARDRLSGIWQSAAGARFLIDDDGKTVGVHVISSDAIRVLTGKLVCREENTETKSLSGTLDVVFAADAPKTHAVDVTMTIGDANHLRLRCENWPQWNSRGEITGKVTTTEFWRRSDSNFRKPTEAEGAD